MEIYGHACVFNVPDNARDVFAPSCFDDFLRDSNHLSVPMLNNHDHSATIGRWLRFHQDGFGLFVVGELDSDSPLAFPYPGLSIKPIRCQGSPNPNVWGGKLCRQAWIEEISLVEMPTNPAARVIGPWCEVNPATVKGR